MRSRLSFVLTASVVLFTVEALSAVSAALPVVARSVLGAHFSAAALLLLFPLAALFAPLLQLTRLGRYNAVAGTALAAAGARVLVCLPATEVRLVAGSVVIAAGAAFLSCAVGFLERRSVAAGVGAAVVLDQLLRLAGWGWSVTLRPWWLLPQLLVAAAVALVAMRWLAMPPAPDSAEEGSQQGSLERRAGGLRLRGGVALALILFLDLHVLARAEVAARWLGVRYEVAAVLLAGAGAAAVLVLLAGNGPLGRYRSWSAGLALTAAAGVAAAWFVGGWVGGAAMAAGHAACILLLGRTLVPASGRRRGGTTTVAFGLLAGLTALYAASFAPAAMVPAAAGAPWIFLLAAVLLVLCLLLLPRPLATQPPLQRRLYAAIAGVVVVTCAASLALRDRPSRPDAPAGADLRVLVRDVAWGVGADGLIDPARVMRETAALGVDVVVLRNAGAAMPTAYGADLGLYLSRRLGLRLYAGAGANRLAGDIVLSRVQVSAFRQLALGDAGAPASLLHLTIPVAADTVHLYLASRSRARTEPAPATLVMAGRRAMLVGSPEALGAGHAAFADAGFLPIGAPAGAEVVLVRGLVADDVVTPPARGAPRPPVGAVLRLPRNGPGSSPTP